MYGFMHFQGILTLSETQTASSGFELVLPTSYAVILSILVNKSFSQFLLGQLCLSLLFLTSKLHYFISTSSVQFFLTTLVISQGEHLSFMVKKKYKQFSQPDGGNKVRVQFSIILTL